MSKETKCSIAELEKRINKVYEHLINGWTRHDILQYISKNKDWNVCDRQVDGYIAKANKRIKEVAKETRDEFIEKAKNRFQDIYKKAMSEKELNTCLRTIEMENKILGYEKINLNHSGEISIPDLRQIFKECYGGTNTNSKAETGDPVTSQE